MRNKWQIIFVAVAFVGGAAVAWAIPHGPAATTTKSAPPMLDVQPILNRLDSADQFERGSAYQELLRVHNELSTGLLKRAGTTPESHLTDLLTKFYSPDMIPLLVERVDYFQVGPVDEHSLLNGYPCALALQRFGQLSTAAILEYLWKTPPEDVTDKANELYARLFIKAYGDAIGGIAGGPKEAIGVIERARDRAYGERAKQNCQRLLDKVKEVTKDWPGVKP